MFLENFAVPVMVGMQGFIILFLWSIHERLVKLQERQENCIFCKSDVSQDEFNKLKRCIQYYD